MLRRGAVGLSADDVEDTIDRLGGELAADASLSATSVHFEVIRRNLEPFADLVARLLGEPAFDEAELARLVREAQAEIVEGRDSDRALVSRAFRRTLFAGHPYGRRVAGTIASLGTLGTKDVRAFFEKHYVRDDALVAVSGDVDRSEAEALCERILAKLPKGPAVPDATPEPVAPKGRRLVFVDKPERTQTQMVIGGLGSHAHDPDHFEIVVGNTAFGGTFTSKLMEEVRVKRGWSYGASSRIAFDRHRESFTMWTAPAATDAAACLGLQLDLLKGLRAEGLGESDVAFVKNYLRRSHAFEVDTARKRVHQPLEEALYDLPAGYHASYLEKIEATTVEGVNAALRRRIPEDDLVVGVVGTHAEIGEALEKAIPGLTEVTVLPIDFD
jgi:zinc protease